MNDYGLLRLPFIVMICLVFQATRWKLVEGVDYKVTIYIGSDADAGSTAEVLVQLTGTTTNTASTSMGKPWTAGSTTTRIIQNPTSIGYIKTIAVTKRQTGTFTDDNLKLVKVTVESTAMASMATFQCPGQFCNIRWPNLISRLHTAVDGGWSDWSLDCSCKKTNDAVRTRTCSNPPQYFGGKNCVGSSSIIIKDGCSQSICIPTTPSSTTTTISTTTTDDDRRSTTTPLTENPLILYGIPVLATLVIIAAIVTIALCVYSFCFAKKEKEEKTTKPNQVVPHDGSVEHSGKPAKRPLMIKPVKKKPEGAGAPKQYTLPVFGPGAEKRELFGDEMDSQTSLLREERDSKASTPPVAASLPSLQGQEENLYTEIAAPKDELKTVGGTPTIVGATKYSTVRTSSGPGPQKAIYRESVPHTISLPGNTIVRAGQVVESEDISEVT